MNSKFNLLILDGAFPECALGLQYRFNVPFMYINTVGFYTGATSLAGSPAPYSITPHFAMALTDNMNFIERTINSITSVLLQIMHMVTSRYFYLDFYIHNRSEFIKSIFHYCFINRAFRTRFFPYGLMSQCQLLFNISTFSSSQSASYRPLFESTWEMIFHRSTSCRRMSALYCKTHISVSVTRGRSCRMLQKSLAFIVSRLNLCQT